MPLPHLLRQLQQQPAPKVRLSFHSSRMLQRPLFTQQCAIRLRHAPNGSNDLPCSNDLLDLNL